MRRINENEKKLIAFFVNQRISQDSSHESFPTSKPDVIKILTETMPWWPALCKDPFCCASR